MTTEVIKFAYWGRFARLAAPMMALTYAGIPFEVESVAGKWETDQHDRKRFPTGDIPVMYVKGKTVCESIAINQYCGLVAGLWPTDPLESTQVLEVLLTAEEIFTGPFVTNFFKASKMFQQLTDEEFKKIREGPFTDTLKFYLGRLNEIATINGHPGFTVGDKFSMADICVWYLYGSVASGQWDHVSTNILEAFPALAAVTAKVNAIKGRSAAWDALMTELGA
jgi:glutathione S-transferase